MTYADAKQWLTTEAPPEVLVAIEKDRREILAEVCRLLEQAAASRARADYDRAIQVLR